MFAGLRLSRAAARLHATSLQSPADRCWFSAASTLPLGGHAPAVECGGAPQPRCLRGAAAASASAARSAWPLARLHSAAAAAALAPTAPRARGVHVGDSAAAAQPSPPSEPLGPPPLPPTDRVVAVKAFYLAQRIDLVALARRYEAHPKSAQRDSLLVSLGGAQDVAFASGAPCVAVTGYGSVVYFDADPGQQAEFSAAASACAVKRLPLPYADELRVAVRPQLAGWSSLAADTLSLRALDVNNLRVVSTVLAQSVALSASRARAARAARAALVSHPRSLLRPRSLRGQGERHAGAVQLAERGHGGGGGKAASAARAPVPAGG